MPSRQARGALVVLSDDGEHLAVARLDEGHQLLVVRLKLWITHDTRRRALHRGFIRQCLDNFADCSNVVQMTSAEYSGPLDFTQFWLDTIIECIPPPSGADDGVLDGGG